MSASDESGFVGLFCISRHAWLFADSSKGARANAVMYTLVESARDNNLDVYEYLNYLLEQMPESDLYNNPEIIDDYLPWSEKLPEKCRLIQKQKKSLK